MDKHDAIGKSFSALHGIGMSVRRCIGLVVVCHMIGFTSSADAQSISSTRHRVAATRSRSIPNPVRQTQYEESMAAGSVVVEEAPVPVETLSITPVHRHRVLMSPGYQVSRKGHLEHHPHHRRPKLHHHHVVQPEPALLPDGRQQRIWKMPYSYGYFGASSSRQWSKHTGYRDIYVEWRLK